MLFKLGLFLIPFENFFFAPSSGWATIAPIVFFVYFCFKIKYIGFLLKKERVILYIIFLVFYGIVLSYLIEFNLLKIIDSLRTIILGLIFYLSLVIRYKIEKKEIMKDIKVLYYGYVISFFVGMSQFLIYRMNNTELINLVKFLSKKSYIGRPQFTFTEPSFIGMHIFGVMLLLYLFLIEEKNDEIKYYRNKIIIFAILSLIISKSTRLIIDVIMILIIILFYKIFKIKNMKKRCIILCLSTTILYFFISIFQNEIVEVVAKKEPRIMKIYEKGIYGDTSLAARYFRINASLKGYKEDYFYLTGYGLGNAYIPLLVGYEDAKKEYKNENSDEIDALKYDKYETSVFCAYIRIISELGILNLIFILIILYSQKYFLEYLIVLYLYIQYDSYAWYSIWIYFFFKNYSKLENKNENKNRSSYSY